MKLAVIVLTLVTSVGLLGCNKPTAEATGAGSPATVDATPDERDRPKGPLDFAIVDALSGPLGKDNIIVDVDGWNRRSWKLRAAHTEGDADKYEARGQVIGYRGADKVTVNWTATVLQFSEERVRVRNVALKIE